MNERCTDCDKGYINVLGSSHYCECDRGQRLKIQDTTLRTSNFTSASEKAFALYVRQHIMNSLPGTDMLSIVDFDRFDAGWQAAEQHHGRTITEEEL